MSEFKLSATPREEEGKGASRRLRRTGLVPAVVYGAGKDPMSLSLQNNELARLSKDEEFYSSILDLDIDGAAEKVLLRDVQRHPYKPFIMHVDFLRVDMDAELRTSVPLHFVGADTNQVVKLGGSFNSLVSEIEILVKPGDLPSSIDVDVSELELGHNLTIADVVLPEGVKSFLVEFGTEDDQKIAIASVAQARESAPEEDDTGAPEAADAAEGSDDAAGDE